MSTQQGQKPPAHVQAAIRAAQASPAPSPGCERSLAPHVRRAIDPTTTRSLERSQGGPQPRTGVLQPSWSFEERVFGSKSGIMTGEVMDLSKPPRSTVVANEGSGMELSFQSNTKPTKVVKELFPNCDGHAETYFLVSVRQKLALQQKDAHLVSSLALSSSPCSSLYGTTTKKGPYAQGCTELLYSAHLTFGLQIGHLFCEKLYRCNSKKGAAASYQALSFLIDKGVVGKVSIKTAVWKHWLEENGVTYNKKISLPLK